MQMYVVSRQHDDGDIIWVTEIWDSAEDHRNALRDARVLALISQAMPMLDTSSNHRQELEVVGGYGI